MKLLGIISDFFLQNDFTDKKVYKITSIVNEPIRNNFQTYFFLRRKFIHKKA